MKKILLSLMVFLLTASATLAQPGDPGQPKQRIQALYIAYITREVKLTEADAQKFWPVHSEYDADMIALRGEKDVIKREEAMVNVKKKFQDRFIKILGAERTNTFFRVDMEFRKRMLERLQQRQQNNFRPGNKVGQGPNWQ